MKFRSLCIDYHAEAFLLQQEREQERERKEVGTVIEIVRAAFVDNDVGKQQQQQASNERPKESCREGREEQKVGLTNDVPQQPIDGSNRNDDVVSRRRRRRPQQIDDSHRVASATEPALLVQSERTSTPTTTNNLDCLPKKKRKLSDCNDCNGSKISGTTSFTDLCRTEHVSGSKSRSCLSSFSTWTSIERNIAEQIQRQRITCVPWYEGLRLESRGTTTPEWWWCLQIGRRCCTLPMMVSPSLRRWTDQAEEEEEEKEPIWLTYSSFSASFAASSSLAIVPYDDHHRRRRHGVPISEAIDTTTAIAAETPATSPAISIPHGPSHNDQRQNQKGLFSFAIGLAVAALWHKKDNILVQEEEEVLEHQSQSQQSTSQQQQPQPFQWDMIQKKDERDGPSSMPQSLSSADDISEPFREDYHTHGTVQNYPRLPETSPHSWPHREEHGSKDEDATVSFADEDVVAVHESFREDDHTRGTIINKNDRLTVTSRHLWPFPGEPHSNDKVAPDAFADKDDVVVHESFTDSVDTRTQVPVRPRVSFSEASCDGGALKKPTNGRKQQQLLWQSSVASSLTSGRKQQQLQQPSVASSSSSGGDALIRGTSARGPLPVAAAGGANEAGEAGEQTGGAAAREERTGSKRRRRSKEEKKERKAKKKAKKSKKSRRRSESKRDSREDLRHEHHQRAKSPPASPLPGEGKEEENSDNGTVGRGADRANRSCGHPLRDNERDDTETPAASALASASSVACLDDELDELRTTLNRKARENYAQEKIIRNHVATSSHRHSMASTRQHNRPVSITMTATRDVNASSSTFLLAGNVGRKGVVGGSQSGLQSRLPVANNGNNTERNDRLDHQRGGAGFYKEPSSSRVQRTSYSQRGAPDIAASAVAAEATGAHRPLPADQAHRSNTQPPGRPADPGLGHTSRRKSNPSPPAPPVQLICSVAFLETWGDVVAKLASGTWAYEVGDDGCNGHDDDDDFGARNAMDDLNHSRNEHRRRGQVIEFVDTVLVDNCGVDIELPNRCGVLVYTSSAMEEDSDLREIVTNVVELVSTGRYTDLFIILCIDVDATPSTLRHIMQLQCAVIQYQGLPPTIAHFKITTTSQISSCLAETILSHEAVWSYESLPILLEGDQSLQCERGRILLSIAPTLSAAGAIQCLRLARGMTPEGPWFRLLLQDGRRRQQIMLAATSRPSRAPEIHPSAMVQISNVLRATIGTGDTPNEHR